MRRIPCWISVAGFVVLGGCFCLYAVTFPPWNGRGSADLSFERARYEALGTANPEAAVQRLSLSVIDGIRDLKLHAKRQDRAGRIAKGMLEDIEKELRR